MLSSGFFGANLEFSEEVPWRRQLAAARDRLEAPACLLERFAVPEHPVQCRRGVRQKGSEQHFGRVDQVEQRAHRVVGSRAILAYLFPRRLAIEPLVAEARQI